MRLEIIDTFGRFRGVLPLKIEAKYFSMREDNTILKPN